MEFTWLPRLAAVIFAATVVWLLSVVVRDIRYCRKELASVRGADSAARQVMVKEAERRASSLGPLAGRVKRTAIVVVGLGYLLYFLSGDGPLEQAGISVVFLGLAAYVVGVGVAGSASSQRQIGEAARDVSED